MQDQTIAALITPPGEGGVSIIRVSGPEAHQIGDQVFQCKAPLPSARPANTFVYGYVVDGEECIDEALLLIWKAPHSYTTEDVIELQGHGGATSARRILQTVLKAGARPAEPGEFTRRAFLNGRIDLMQAEAIMDLVRSQTDRAQTAALQQLSGSLSSSINNIYDNLIVIAAQLEATLDFPEDELPATVMPAIRSSLEDAISTITALLATWNEGHLLRDGALVVLSGKPNAGKSTLMNALLDKDRAIVSDVAGTTRDTIEEHFLLNGIPLRIVDTAGLRKTDCDIEAEGIRRTRRHIDEADLNIHLIDLSQPADEETQRHLQDLVPGKSLILCNKADLPSVYDGPLPDAIPVLETILTDKVGLQEVKTHLSQLLSDSPELASSPHAVISERHRQVLDLVKQEVQATRDLLSEHGEDIVFAITRMRDALTELGKATGREYHEELLDSIFGQFCIGK